MDYLFSKSWQVALCDGFSSSRAARLCFSVSPTMFVGCQPSQSRYFVCRYFAFCSKHRRRVAPTASPTRWQKVVAVVMTGWSIKVTKNTFQIIEKHPNLSSFLWYPLSLFSLLFLSLQSVTFFSIVRFTRIKIYTQINFLECCELRSLRSTLIR